MIVVKFVATYRLDEPTVTAEFEPAEVATPGSGQHDTVWGLSHFVEWQCIAGSDLFMLAD
jgi:hypothetical protein